MKRINSAIVYWYLLFLIVPTLACQKNTQAQKATTLFVSTPLAKAILPGSIDEASGIADSKTNPGHLWVEQDSGNPNDLTLLSWEGKIVKKINIKPANNRDWEDIVVGNGPVAGQSYIYLAETGDNNQSFSQYIIYRFVEPAATTDTVYNLDKIIFQYPDGSHDAEAILVDGRTSDIYIITKRDSPSRIYKLPYPQSTGSINTAVFAGSLNYSGIVSAASSANGNEILIKTYGSINYWKRNSTESIEDAIKKMPVQLGYMLEPQGEAICFKNDQSGFYTLSEKPSLFSFVNLNFYKRK